jgi:hypothetical protein
MYTKEFTFCTYILAWSRALSVSKKKTFCRFFFTDQRLNCKFFFVSLPSGRVDGSLFKPTNFYRLEIGFLNFLDAVVTLASTFVKNN